MALHTAKDSSLQTELKRVHMILLLLKCTCTYGLHRRSFADTNHSDTEQGMAATALDVHLC